MSCHCPSSPEEDSKNVQRLGEERGKPSFMAGLLHITASSTGSACGLRSAGMDCHLLGMLLLGKGDPSTMLAKNSCD